MSRNNRPGVGHITATPKDESMLQLLGGGISSGSVMVTRSQYKALNRLYGFHPEDTGTSAGRFMQAGADRNVFRHAEADGLRMVTWLSKYCEPGDDPMKLLIRLASEAGWDIDPSDIMWAEDEENSYEDSDEG